MLSFAGSTFRALALGVFALFLVHSGYLTASRAAAGIAQAASLAGEDSRAIRRRTLGPSYVRAIERLRRAIPRDGEYLLVRDVTEGDGGGAYWIRFELAPRRARFLGDWTGLPDGRTLRRELPPGPCQVIIAFTEPRPPVLMDREDFLRALDRSHGGP
jgi:hypothetical protein